jgi:hypothetical protein
MQLTLVWDNKNATQSRAFLMKCLNSAVIPKARRAGQKTLTMQQMQRVQAAKALGKGWWAAIFSQAKREREKRLFGPVDLRTVRSQVHIWNENCSYCYILGYWCSSNYKIADCRVPGADKVRQTRVALQREMVEFRKSGGTFCSGQCEFVLNLCLIEPDRTLDPECACEAAVLDALSAMTTKIDNDLTEGDVAALKERTPGGEEKDLDAWLCSTEELYWEESATATRVFAQLSGNCRRTATSKPMDRAVKLKLVQEHLARQADKDAQLWLDGKQPRGLHRLIG